MCSEKVTLCSRRFYRSNQIPEENGLPFYEGPYVVKRAFSSGALILRTMDGEEFTRLVNADAVKKYFAKKKRIAR